MFLTLNRKFELSASRRYAPHPDVLPSDTTGRYGSGQNYRVYFVFHGPVDPKTGMVQELSILKRRLEAEVISVYDHHFLNDLIEGNPTPERFAQRLLADAQRALVGQGVAVVACHVDEDGSLAATAYADGRVERHWTHQIGGAIERTTFLGTPDAQTGLIACVVPLRMVHWDGRQGTGIADGKRFCVAGRFFSATHHLHRAGCTEAEDGQLFGKCSRPHGHRFYVEATFDSDRVDAGRVSDWVDAVALSWSGRDLGDEVPEFSNRMVTCESIVTVLWESALSELGEPVRLRFQETFNNRFAARPQDVFRV
ncbi:MAG: 6-carboxytetrahydropterin synthase [Candidatus Margulisiibacteriota bacterium]